MSTNDKPPSAVLCCCTGRFEGEDRDISSARGEVVAMLQSHGLSVGKRVLDVGAGTGLFLFYMHCNNQLFFSSISTTFMVAGLFVGPISKVIGQSGMLFATEVSDVFTTHLKELVVKQQLFNVTVELVPSVVQAYSHIPDGSIDIAFICDVYHHFEFPKTTMRGRQLMLYIIWIRCACYFISSLLNCSVTLQQYAGL